MTESNRKSSNVAMEQIIENMTAGIHNVDGQYIQLNFTPPQSPSEHAWGPQNQIPNPYMQYTNIGSIHNSDPHMVYPMNQQIPQYPSQAIPFNYIQQPNVYAAESYDKTNEVQSNYVMFQNQNIPSKDVPPYYSSDYRYYLPSDRQINHTPIDNNYIHNSHPSISNPTQLIENVVGNWVPNMTGTYSPFGNAQNTSKPGIGNIFEVQPEVVPPIFECNKTLEEKNEEMLNFHFNRDTKKPRMVAEVKPMRPSYSDVLTKSAPPPNTKANKVDVKDTRLKKDSTKKGTKSEKSQKSTAAQPPRNNSEVKIDKNVNNTKNNDKNSKSERSPKTNRKWVSLDSINGSGSDQNDDDIRKSKKSEENLNNKNLPKANSKSGKTSDFENVEYSNGNKNDTLNITKTTIRKGNKFNLKPRVSDSFGNGDKPPPGAKRSQRTRKRENNISFGIVGQKIRQYVPGWWKLFVNFILWLVHLIFDICSLSVHLSRDAICNFYTWTKIQKTAFIDVTVTILSRIRVLKWLWRKFVKKNETEENTRPFMHSGLHHNITMPTTGEEAMKRLLACKGKDPYSILGVMPTCTDDDIKRYYKRQAFLVHPDKNQQPGAEEAFKILVHAFDMIGEPERRAAYDRGVAESAQVEQAWSELTELLAQLQKKVEAAANTIRCSACGLRHKRIKIDRPSYAARNCSNCKIHHAAREGDIWAETRCLGFLWHYYACMEGGVYDITEWAGCQKDSLKHLRPDSHNVQYRIALGKQNGQTRRHSSSPRNERPPDLENLLNSLYGNQDSSSNSRRRNKKGTK
ncbi:hypothetical protein RN001_012466 [Aquatica leii]|uniref:J domain-containing protein n=1 Tax=Aquatica leii TaxID=1421715 RepID=A0AAN7SF74_9COLE|nr:hypothetical protein RN001_012466 [Aquatica leii]